ncbi:MAG TPA: 6-carboxytetrahydropterin synthase [Blastocatellia bacterium]|nr:6-carboxytetrahydropterin synthase [Blastocatellia bacterium]HMZ21884.1 6-carboxytetrahydropterin synthase [Blastocatellia bacterium]
MKFSAGHFTIFSATRRENLHGHNFSIHVEIDGVVSNNGMTFDYGECKKWLEDFCRELNEIVLLPAQSPHLAIREENKHVIARFADEEMIFLKRDVKLLPIRNVTCEELAAYLLERLVAEMKTDPQYDVNLIIARVFSGPGQSASAQWEAA